MIVDDILGKSRRYEPSRKPIVKEYDTHYTSLDPELRKLRYVMVAPTPANLEHCFWNDSVSQSFGVMTPALIVGDGLRIRANDRIKSLIDDFNEEINVEHQTIDDYFTHSWIDMMVHHNGSVWRIDYNKDYTTKVDIQRLDPKTLTYERENHNGWAAYIQNVPNYKHYRSKTSYYRHLKEDKYEIMNFSNSRKIVIPDELDVILKGNFFLKPPVASAMIYMVYKRFILYFMRKYSQTLWTPKMLFGVGDPRTTQYPVDDEDMQQSIDDLAELIPDLMTTFSAAAIPGNITPYEVGKNSIRGSESFIKYIELLNKEIMMAQFASMGLRESSGTELATSRTLKELYLQFIQGMRRRYAISWEKFYRYALLKVNRVKASPGDINIEYSPLKFEPTEEYMKGVDLAVRAGVFKDRNEIRKAAQTIWSWLEEVPLNKNTKIKFIHPLQNNMQQKTSPIQQQQKPPQVNKKLENTFIGSQL